MLSKGFCWSGSLYVNLHICIFRNTWLCAIAQARVNAGGVLVLYSYLPAWPRQMRWAQSSCLLSAYNCSGFISDSDCSRQNQQYSFYLYVFRYVKLRAIIRAKTVPFLVIFSWLVSVFVFTILCCNNISQFKALILIPMNVLRIFGFGCYLCWTASVLCCGSACASVVFELCGQHCVEASVPALMLVCCTISGNIVCLL